MNHTANRPFTYTISSSDMCGDLSIDCDTCGEYIGGPNNYFTVIGSAELDQLLDEHTAECQPFRAETKKGERK